MKLGTKVKVSLFGKTEIGTVDGFWEDENGKGVEVFFAPEVEGETGFHKDYPIDRVQIVA
ncbi:MAG: hypothetical protein CMJ75_18770 [Planctomycetaceae bacterium]|nr:hypothetical protein [Planctomycetaceae bacterium]